MKKLISVLCIFVQSSYCFAGVQAWEDPETELAMSAVQKILDLGLIQAAKNSNTVALSSSDGKTFEKTDMNAGASEWAQTSAVAWTDPKMKDAVTGQSLVIEYKIENEALTLTPGLYDEKSKEARFKQSDKTSFSFANPEEVSGISSQIDLIVSSFVANSGMEFGVNNLGTSKGSAGGFRGSAVRAQSYGPCIQSVVISLVVLGVFYRLWNIGFGKKGSAKAFRTQAMVAVGTLLGAVSVITCVANMFTSDD